MHADPRILANITPVGGRLDFEHDQGLASVIDAGVGQYTLVFDKDLDSKRYTAICSSDERGYARERIDLERTKSEYPIAVSSKDGPSDARVNVVIYG